jgi:hypothetical protein
MNDSDAVAATCFDGWVDEFRFTIAAARYTANFTPPTDAFPRNTGDSNWGSVKCATRINRHSGFNFGVMCDSWGSGFGDLEPFDVETEALRTEC